jgi:hypothetical protein
MMAALARNRTDAPLSLRRPTQGSHWIKRRLGLLLTVTIDGGQPNQTRRCDGYGVGFTQMDDHTDRSGLRDGSRLRNFVNAAYMLKELAGPASMLRSLQEPPCWAG